MHEWIKSIETQTRNGGESQEKNSNKKPHYFQRSNPNLTSSESQRKTKSQIHPQKLSQSTKPQIQPPEPRPKLGFLKIYKHRTHETKRKLLNFNFRNLASMLTTGEQIPKKKRVSLSRKEFLSLKAYPM